MSRYKFGSCDALIINDLDIKNKIICYLFNSVNLSKYRYNMLDNIQQLQFLKSNPHYVSPNFKGYNYFLIFTKINNNSYCIAIDKKKLSYHKEKVNIKRTVIYKLKIMTSPSIFRGTIFDCKLIRNKEYKYFMLIKDCYKIMGNNIDDMELNDKMTYLNSIINNQFNKCNYFDFKVNKLYKYSSLKNLIKNVIPKCSLDIHGLIFYPKYSGISIIYVNRKKSLNKLQQNGSVCEVKVNIESNEVINNETYHMIKELKNFLKARKYSYEKEGKKKILLLEKTNISDVYNVYEKENNKLGIAHIPNLKISSYCYENIKENDLVKFQCIYNNNFKKWIPISTA